MLERVHCWWECKLIQPVRKTAWRFLKKLKIELPYNPGIPLPGIHHEKKTLIQKDTRTAMFTAVFLIIAKASLIVLIGKNPPARQETWVLSLSWEDPLEKG